MIEPVFLFKETGFPLSAYWVALLPCFSIAVLLLLHQSRKAGLKARLPLLFVLVAVPTSLFLGRLLYCLVRYEDIFFSETGEFTGLGNFFAPSPYGFSIVGIILGALISAYSLARAQGIKTSIITDAAALPAALLIAFCRWLEPLNGQGYGDFVETPVLQHFPLSISSEMGDYFLSVSFIQGSLAIMLFAALLLMGKRLDARGLKTVFFLLFFTASQILPESFRRDDALFIFIFARVTQVGYAVLFSLTAFTVFWRNAKSTGQVIQFYLNSGLILVGVVICILCEFALDKTNYPKAAVYAVMAVTLLLMSLYTWPKARVERTVS
jgi:prolipoprotein diacylglyceryltransferase